MDILEKSSLGPWLKWFISRTLKAGGHIPQHIAFIMDGNRRYARKENKELLAGHGLGGKRLMKTLDWCYELGIVHVSAFAFSIENFKRSKEEVDGLLQLAKKKLEKNMSDITKKYKIQYLGDLKLLPTDLQITIADAVAKSKHITTATLNLCIAYTSTDEMIRATSNIAEGVKKGMLRTSDINNDLFEQCLDTNGCSVPDIIVRTSGEIRLSDFMLWQSSYSGLVFLDVLWPEFSFYHLILSILQYQKNRRYIEEVRLHYKNTQQKRNQETSNIPTKNGMVNSDVNSIQQDKRITDFLHWKASNFDKTIAVLLEQS